MTFKSITHAHVRKAEKPGDPSGRQSRPLTTRERQIRDAFITAVQALGGQMDYAQIAQIIAQGIQSLIPNMGMGDFISALDPAVQAIAQEQIASGVAQVANLPEYIKASMRFDVTDPRALAWAQERGSELVRGVTAEQRKVLGNIISKGIETGKTTVQIADEVKGAIGLHERWAQAVVTSREKELQRLLRSGITEADATAKANAHAARYKERLLKARATNIARTEVITASNQGRFLSWVQAGDQGLINLQTSRKEWVTGSLSSSAGRKQVCDICAPLSGIQAKWDEDFPGVGINMPPAHPSCRCTAVLVPVQGDEIKRLLEQDDASKAQGWEDNGTFGGSRCDVCPGDCKRRVSLSKAVGALNCSGLPAAAPPTAVPVKGKEEISKGDVLYVQGYKDGYPVISKSGDKIFVSLPSSGGKMGTFTFNPNKKYAIVPGPAKADAALEKWVSEHKLGKNTFAWAPTANGNPPVIIKGKADLHPGDTLFFTTDKSKTGWIVLGPDADGKIGVVHPTTGKKYKLAIPDKIPAGGAKKYAIHPGPQKGKHLLNMPGDGAQIPGSVKPPLPGAFTPSVGAVTGHAKFPGNTYEIVSVSGTKTKIKTAAGTYFDVDTNDLVGLPTGVQVKAGKLTKTVQGFTDQGNVLFTDGTTGALKTIKPHTATPGGGAAAGLGNKGPASKPKPPAAPVIPIPDHEKLKVSVNWNSDSEAVDWGKKSFAGWRTSLTQTEAKALRSYTGSGYGSYNARLRNGGSPVAGKETPTIKAAREALERGVTPEDIILVRGIGLHGEVLDQYKKLQVGDVIHDSGFGSTSVGARAAFSRNVTFRIHAPKGTKGAYLGKGPHSSFGDSEREFLLPPGCTMKVEAVVTSGNSTIFDLTIISQGNPPPKFDITVFAKRKLGMMNA